MANTNNVVELLSNGQMTALSTAKSLIEYVKDNPGCNVLAVVHEPEGGSITMGWSKMDSSTMSLMIHFARYKWERATFEEV